MNVIMFIYVFVLFFVLTPGVLVYLPPKSSKMITAATHAVIFALIWTLTHKMVWRLTSRMEGMSNLINTAIPVPVPSGGGGIPAIPQTTKKSPGM
jgi:hypothetical protein